MKFWTFLQLPDFCVPKKKAKIYFCSYFDVLFCIHSSIFLRKLLNFFLNVEKNVEIFFCQNFTFHGWGQGHFVSLPGLCLWTPHAIGLRTLVETGKRSTTFQQKSLPFYFQDFFCLKIVWNVCLNFYFEFWQRKRCEKKYIFDEIFRTLKKKKL